MAGGLTTKTIDFQNTSAQKKYLRKRVCGLNYKLKIFSLSAILVLIAFFSKEYLFERTIYYQCMDYRKKFPVVTKIESHGLLDIGGHITITAYDNDGNGRVFEAPISGYPIFQTELNWFPSIAEDGSQNIYKYIVMFNSRSGEFSVGESLNRHNPKIFYSGLCEL